MMIQSEMAHMCRINGLKKAEESFRATSWHFDKRKNLMPVPVAMAYADGYLQASNDLIQEILYMFEGVRAEDIKQMLNRHKSKLKDIRKTSEVD